MSNSPRRTERKRASATTAPKQPLSKRLPGMSDGQVTLYQNTANKISNDPEHPKYATALRAIPIIEAEIRRRANALTPQPANKAGAE